MKIIADIKIPDGADHISIKIMATGYGVRYENQGVFKITQDKKIGAPICFIALADVESEE